MPISIVNENGKITSPPNRSSASTASSVVPDGQDRARHGLIDRHVEHVSSSVRRMELEVLADAVVDDDRVVQAVADDREQGRQDLQVELDPQAEPIREDQDPRRHEHVVDQRDHGARRIARAEAEGDVDQDRDRRHQHRVRAVAAQVGADLRAHVLDALLDEGADRIADRRLESRDPRIRREPVRLAGRRGRGLVLGLRLELDQELASCPPRRSGSPPRRGTPRPA